VRQAPNRHLRRDAALKLPAGCEFCREFVGHPGHEFHRRYAGILESRIVWKSASHILLPSLGQLSPGHVLLLPWRHVSSFAELTPIEEAEAESALEGLRRFLGSAFGKPLIFEHGLPPDASSGGCGVIHAHTHIVPIEREVQGPPDGSGLEWVELRDRWPSSAVSGPRHEYIYYETQNGEGFLTAGETIPSQLVRRWLASQLGAPWDWRKASIETGLLNLVRWMKAQAKPPHPFWQL